MKASSIEWKRFAPSISINRNVDTHVSHRRQGTDVDEHQQHENEPLASLADKVRELVAQRGYHRFQPAERRVQAEGDEHQEEDYRPERTATHQRDCLGIHDEHKTGALNLRNVKGLKF